MNRNALTAISWAFGALATGAAIALAGGLAESALLLVRAQHPTFSAVLATLGAWFVLMVPLTLGALVLRRAWSVGGAAPALRRRYLIQLAWASALLGVGVGVGAGLVAGRLADVGLLGPLVAVGAAAAVWGLAASARLMWGPLSKAIDWCAATRLRCAVSVVAPLASILLWVNTVVLRDISALPVILPGLALVCAVPLIGRRSRALWFAPVALGALAFFGAHQYGTNASARQAIQETEGVAHRIAGGLLALGDADGDGASRWLGGGDCADDDPSIHPLAADLPGNQLDEDCDGTDAQPIKIRRAKVQRVRRSKPLRRRWNVLFVTIDALRPDRMSVFGHDRETSPNIDALAAHGLVFHRAYSAATATRHAVPPMFASRSLDDMLLERKSTSLLVLPGNNLLFERLKAHGYHTEAHVGAYLQKRAWFGLEQGVDRFVGHPQMGIRDPLTGPVLVDAFREMLDRPEAELDARPWAAWLHFQEPHDPYVSHPDFAFGDQPLDRYDSEIAMVDRFVGELWSLLQERNLTHSTIVVVTSDHGEEFGEHGKQFHGKQLYEETVRVPIIIHVPGQPRVDIQAPSSTLDITETVANLVGARGGADYGAVSHVARLMDPTLRPPWDRPIYVDSIHHDDQPSQRQVALIEWPHKLILDFRNGSSRLFNLVKDPGEKKNLRRSQARLADEMAGKVRGRVQRQARETVAALLAQRVSRTVPPGAEPKPLVAGVELVGASLRELGDDWYEVSVTYRATGDRRPDYRFEVSWVDGKRPKRRRNARPLAGRYPTHRWQTGDVVVDVARANLPRLKGLLSVRLSVFRDKKTRVVGPVEIARQVERQASPGAGN